MKANDLSLADPQSLANKPGAPSVGALSSADRGWWVSCRRFAIASCGIGCVGLAYIGAIIPGMPTTIFLIMACYLFTRSCPYLEQRLIRNSFFARFHQYLDRPAEMPWRARLIALAAMWISSAGSAAVLLASGRTAIWVPLLVIGLAALGTLVILAMGRRPFWFGKS